MKALTFQAKQQIVLASVDDPSILKPTDAIVKVELTTVCGSDMHVFHGRETGLDCGTIMGHEFVGEIVELGKAVKHLSIGDKVVSPFSTNCGDCHFCEIGLTARCLQGQLYGWVQNGKGLHGTQAEYIRVPLAEATLVKYDASIPPEEALLTGDILATGYHCALQARIQAKGIYVLVGCGPVGLMAVLGAKILGAEQIYAIDSIPARLKMAEEMGAIPLHLHKQNPVEAVLEASKGLGADGVMEAVGSPAASRLAFDLVRPGGIISTVGVHTSSSFAFSPVDAYDKNLTFTIGRCSARHYMENLLQLIQEKDLGLGRVITHRFALEQGPAMYDFFDKKEDNCIKIILKP